MLLKSGRKNYNVKHNRYASTDPHSLDFGIILKSHIKLHNEQHGLTYFTQLMVCGSRLGNKVKMILLVPKHHFRSAHIYMIFIKLWWLISVCVQNTSSYIFIRVRNVSLFFETLSGCIKACTLIFRHQL